MRPTPALLLLLLMTACTATQNLGGGGDRDGGDAADAGPDAFDEDDADGSAGDPGPISVLPEPEPAELPDGALRVFVTASSYSGDLGGLAGADALCADAAAGAELGGRWIAWLSDGQTDALDRIDGDGPWYRLDGRRAFNNAAQLRAQPLAPLSVDQFGEDVYEDVWTGTDNGGRGVTFEGIDFCADWTSREPYEEREGSIWPIKAAVGSSSATDGWTYTGDWQSGLECSERNHLYCFEQP